MLFDCFINWFSCFNHQHDFSWLNGTWEFCCQPEDQNVFGLENFDIRKLKFDGIEIKKTDKIICCFKVGWKFGLFFDFSTRLNTENF